MKAGTAIAQWILVRAFLSATQLLEKLKSPDWVRTAGHVQLRRGVCDTVYRQIWAISPIYGESPTAKRLMDDPNQWP